MGAIFVTFLLSQTAKTCHNNLVSIQYEFYMFFGREDALADETVSLPRGNQTKA